MKKERKEKKKLGLLFLLAGMLVISSLILIIAAPVNPDGISDVETTERANGPLQNVTIGGGKIATFNLTADIQNPRWKAFVGNVQGSFSLGDATGSVIYDWTLASVTGRVYTSRHDTVTWDGINCANNIQMEAENVYLEHSGSSDNITATFRNDANHDQFFVGAQSILANTCPTLNTYRDGDTSQGAGSDFEEMVLADASDRLIYATILEDDALGFDGKLYDFQMIVPENGSASFTGATPYYLYVEISS